MTTEVKKWGNSLAVRLPREMSRRLALREGSEITIREENARIVIGKPTPADKSIDKNAWRRFVLPMRQRKENVSGNIDRILYGSNR